MYFLNIVLAVLTIVAYLLPFLAPKLFPILAVLTLFLPFMLVLNALFFCYWVIQVKRQLLLSGFILAIGFTFINKWYKFSSTENQLPTDLKILSYNVRLFNKFQWSEKQTVPVEISDFIKENKPDFLCIQEFSNADKFDQKSYKYKYINWKGNKIKTGQAIFSKFKIINSGEIVFPNSINNIVFCDIKLKNDTVRIYSMHLESLKITPDVNEINQDLNEINQTKSGRMFRLISKAFKAQQQQSEIFMAHKNNCKFPVFICGDMNNSAFSYVYQNIRGDLQDSFVVAGTGFGKTYDFKYYPARIDYIFMDKKFKITNFKTFNEIKDSDHFPVMATFSLH